MVTTQTVPSTKTLRDYVEARSIPVPFAGCWLWLLRFGDHSYGRGQGYGLSSVRLGYAVGLRSPLAHRLSYLAFKGPIPEGMLVQHSCDSPWCVNPDHLSLGTDKSNAEDKMRKGRGRFPPSHRRKLTNDQASEIRSSTDPLSQLASRFGVSATAVRRIRNGRQYKEVQP